MLLLRNSWSRPAAVAVLCALALAGCAGKQKKARLVYEERPVELLYATGANRLDRRQWAQAVQYFQEVERQHPYSEWSRRSILMQAYAHYQANAYAEAIGDLYVLGGPIIGRFEGVLAGHSLNNALVRALLARPDAWRVSTLAEDLRVAV